MPDRRWIVSAGLVLMVIACILAGTFIVQFLPGYRSYASTVGAQAANRLDVQGRDATIIFLPRKGNRIKVAASGRYSSHRPVVSARTANSETYVIAQCPVQNENCNVTVRIWLPPDIDVTAYSDNGAIQANDLTGSLRLSSINGEIDVSGSSGQLSLQNQNSNINIENSRSRRVSATTVNGGVTAVFHAAPDFVDAGSRNGTVSLTVPFIAAAPDSYAISAHTTNGHSDIGVPNSANAGRKLIATSQNGDVVVQYGS